MLLHIHMFYNGLFEEDDKYNMPSSTFTTPTKPSQQSLTTSFTNEDSDNGDNVNSSPFLSEESPINDVSSPTYPPTPNRILSLSKTKDIGRKDKTRKTDDHTTPRRLLSKNVEDEQNLEEKTLKPNNHPKLFNLGSVVLDEHFRRVDQPRPRPSSRPGPDTNDDTAELFVNDRSTATSSSSSFPSPSSSSLNALGDIFSSSEESSVDVVTTNTSRIRQNRRATTYSRRNTRDGNLYKHSDRILGISTIRSADNNQYAALSQEEQKPKSKPSTNKLLRELAPHNNDGILEARNIDGEAGQRTTRRQSDIISSGETNNDITTPTLQTDEELREELQFEKDTNRAIEESKKNMKQNRKI